MRQRFAITLIVLASCAPATIVETPSSMAPSSSSAPSSISSAPVVVRFDPVNPSLSTLRDATIEAGEFELQETLTSNDAYVRHAIRYRSEGLWISGELFIPRGVGPFPLVVTAHGHIDPAIYTRGRGLRREQDALARRGFAVLHPDFRGHALSDGASNEAGNYDGGLAYSVDVAGGILALRRAALPSIDAERVGILGHSMSGGVALNLGVARPDLLDAIVLYAPVNADAWENFARWRGDGERGAQTRALRGDRTSQPAAWDAISARSMLASLRAPVVVFHGTSDRDVPYAWSQQLVRDVEAAGGSIRLVTYEGEGHEFGPRWREFISSVADVFDEALRPAPLATTETQ